MTYRILSILSAAFASTMLAGELFLYFSTGTINPTLFAALGITGLLSGNLIALRIHRRLFWAELVFCLILTTGVSIAIANDGGIESPLWFFQLLVIFGTGFIFGKNGVMAQGAFTLCMATVYYLAFQGPMDKQVLTAFTSLIASTVVFSVLSFLYEREKERKAVTMENLLVANEELSQFAYRTSHDLKAPLTSIKSLAGLISEDIDAGNLDEASQIATRIIRRADSLERLIVDILDLAKTDVVDAPAEPIDILRLVEQITDRLSTSDLYDDNDVTIEFDIRHSGQINLPAARVTQVLENLVSNAILYRDPAKAQPYVKIASSDKAEGVEVTVLDNGLGVDDRNVNRMFEMFQRFHPYAASGSGLGLYIVKKHVDKLGAGIEYRRTKDGSLFTLNLQRNMGN